MFLWSCIYLSSNYMSTFFTLPHSRSVCWRIVHILKLSFRIFSSKWHLVFSSLTRVVFTSNCISELFVSSNSVVLLHNVSLSIFPPTHASTHWLQHNNTCSTLGVFAAIPQPCCGDYSNLWLLQHIYLKHIWKNSVLAFQDGNDVRQTT